MALQTLLLVSVASPQGPVALTLEYDDAQLIATGVICDNPSSLNVLFTISRDSDGKTVQRVFGPGLGQRINIPSNPANRIDVVINSRGRLDGYTAGASYPTSLPPG